MRNLIKNIIKVLGITNESTKCVVSKTESSIKINNRISDRKRIRDKHQEKTNIRNNAKNYNPQFIYNYTDHNIINSVKNSPLES